MKSFSAIVAIVLATALPVFSQSVLDLPTCAQNDVLVAMAATGCGQTDFACICKNQPFLDSLVNTIPTHCTLEETYIVSSFSIIFCFQAGVKITLPASIQKPVAGATTSSASVTPAANATASITRAVLTSASTAAVTTSTSPAAGAVQTAGLVGLMGAVFVGVIGL